MRDYPWDLAFPQRNSNFKLVIIWGTIVPKWDWAVIEDLTRSRASLHFSFKILQPRMPFRKTRLQLRAPISQLNFENAHQFFVRENRIRGPLRGGWILRRRDRNNGTSDQRLPMG